MRKFSAVILLSFFFLFSCTASTTPSPIVLPESTFALVEVPSASPTIALPTFIPPPLSSSADQPVFLAWPLPAHIGLARISQYPNTPWTWNYLGLNEGYQCPPQFGYLESSLEYWRDPSIPMAQDQAQADPHNFQMIECYTTGGIEGERGHEATDIKAPADTPVYAAADGKVAGWGINGLNTLLILKHCLGGAWNTDDQCTGVKWYTTYMHIVINQAILVKDLDISQGMQVGTIFNQHDNSHVHFEVGLTERSYANFVNPWGRNESPWLGCMWLDQSLCPFPNLNTNRFAFLKNSLLSIRQGEDAILIKDIQGIKKISLWKDRIGILDAQGKLFFQEGRFNTSEDSMQNWVLLSEHVRDFEITNRFVAKLDLNGNLLVNDPNQSNEWILQAENIRAFSISDHRIGYIGVNTDLVVKENWSDSPWIVLAQGVAAFQLTDNRIAVLDSQGTLYVNEGAINAEWKLMAEDVKAFQLTNLRIGILDKDGNLLVKEGNLRAEWVTLARNVVWFQLSNYRLVLQNIDGSFSYQAGNLYQPINSQLSGIQSMLMNDKVPAIMP